MINELYQMWIADGRPAKYNKDVHRTELVYAPVLMNLYDIMEKLEAKGHPVPLITKVPEQ